MNGFLLKYSVKASLLFFTVREAFAADSADYIGSGSSAPEYEMREVLQLTKEETGKDPGGHGAEQAGDYAAGAGKASAGLPQMDAAWFPSQIFWLGVTFLCMYVVFARKILPEISSTLESRRRHIEEDLDTAQDMKEQAEKVHQAYDEILDTARRKSTDIFARADQAVKRKADQRLDEFRDRAAQENAALEKLIAQAKAAARPEMHEVAAEITVAITEKIAGIAADPDQAKNLIGNIDRQAA